MDVIGNGTISDVNDADDDCTISGTSNDTETAAANNRENLSESAKAGASKPSSVGKDGARGGKGSRGGSQRGRAGGSAGSKRKVSEAADADTGKTSPKKTKPKVGANGKVKKSVKAAGPRPAGPLPSTFCFFDPPAPELAESVDGDAGAADDEEKAASKVAVKEEANDGNDDVAEEAADHEKAGGTGSIGDNGNDDGDDNDDDLQNESPGRKKAKLEDVTMATSEILNGVAADMKKNEKMVGIEASA